MTCTGQTHCVTANGSTPAHCESNKCGDVTCTASEACFNGACVDQACVTKVCADGERCVNGGCIKQCCEPGAACPPSGACLDGRQYTQECNGFRCPSGFICIGGGCQPLGKCNIVYTSPGTPEGINADGKDNDHNCVIDDIHVRPKFCRTGPFASYWPELEDPPKTGDHIRKGTACSWCPSTKDWNCSTNADDAGRSIYLGLKYFPNRFPSNIYMVSSCVEYILPRRMRAKAINVWFGGASLIPCDRKDSCVGDCHPTILVVLTRSRSNSAWVEQCDFTTRLDITSKVRCDLDWDVKPYQDIERVLLCRDASTSSELSQNISIDSLVVDGFGIADLSSTLCKPGYDD